MVAHGYGIAAVGMPNLLFSNLIWGYLVRAIPEINGMLGYSIATISVLVIFGAVILHAFRRLGFGWLVMLSVLILYCYVLFFFHNLQLCRLAHSWSGRLLASLWAAGKQTSTAGRLFACVLWLSRPQP